MDKEYGDIDSWIGEDDDDYCYACDDWVEDDGHGNCMTNTKTDFGKDRDCRVGYQLRMMMMMELKTIWMHSPWMGRLGRTLMETA